jgi:hypothetical protein
VSRPRARPENNLFKVRQLPAALAEKRIALLIGNKDYKPGVGALVNPLN